MGKLENLQLDITRMSSTELLAFTRDIRQDRVTIKTTKKGTAAVKKSKAKRKKVTKKKEQVKTVEKMISLMSKEEKLALLERMKNNV